VHTYTVLVRKPEGRDHFEELGLDERTLLKWIFMKWEGGRKGMESIDLAQKKGLCSME
jgi:hypothetical protein